MRSSWFVGYVMVLFFVWFLPLCIVCGTQVEYGASLLDIEIEITRADHEELKTEDLERVPEDIAIVGDQIKIFAVLQPVIVQTDPKKYRETGEFLVKFFFENILTNETGFIGSERVRGLPSPANEVVRPAVIWDPSEMVPGYYRITVEGDFEEQAWKIKKPDQDTKIKVVAVGKRIGFFENQEVLRCPMGGDVMSMPDELVGDEVDNWKRQKKIVDVEEKEVKFINLGTEVLEKTDLWGKKVHCEWKEPESGFLEMKDACEIYKHYSFPSLSLLPGDIGELWLYLEYPLAQAQIEQKELGAPKEIQLRIRTQGDVASPWRYVPDRRSFFKLYSWVDLWTIPERSACSVTEQAIIPGVLDVLPVVVEDEDSKQLFVFHVVTHVVTNGSESELCSHLYSHVMKNDTPKDPTEKQYVFENVVPRWAEKDKDGNTQLVSWTPVPPGRITALTARKNAAGDIILYIGTDQGYIYALKDTVGQGDSTNRFYYRERWAKNETQGQKIGNVSHTPDVITDDAGNHVRIVFGSTNGLFVMTPEGGAEFPPFTDLGSITQPPVHTENGDIWFATGADVYRLPAGQKSDPVKYPASTNVSTPLTPAHLDNKDYVFFGRGKHLYMEATSRSDQRISEVCVDCTTLGVAVASGEKEQLNDAVVYVTADDCRVHKLRFDFVGKEFVEDVLDEDCRPPVFQGELTGPPVVFQNNAKRVLAVFITTKKGELRAFDENLCQSVKVILWPPEQNLQNPKKVEFKFDEDNELRMPVLAEHTTIKSLWTNDKLAALLVASADGMLYAFDLSAIHP